MKFNVITLIWSIALMLLTFQICLLWIDWQFTNTIAYKFMLLLDGFMFGLVISDWSHN
jgi:NADH:ubiquinone oxidoreductase subunit K